MSKKAQTVFVVLSVLLMIGVLAYAVYKDSILGIGRPPIDGKNEVTVHYNLHVDSVTRLNHRCNVLLFDNDDKVELSIYRSNYEDRYYNEPIAKTTDDFYYDWGATSGANYYYYISYQKSENEIVRSYVRKEGYQARQVTQVAAIMYHYFNTEEDLQNGAFKDSYIDPSEFEADLKYFNEHNIKTIGFTELNAYLKGEIELPQQCVMLLIDDGHYSIYKYVKDLLIKYNCKANLAIIGEFVERTQYRGDKPQKNYWLNWEEIEELAKLDCFEIGSHSNYLHHNTDDYERHGIAKLKNETYEEYLSVLENDLIPLNQKLKEVCGYEPQYIAYPFNDVSKDSLAILRNENIKYKFLVTGDGNYHSQTKTECNYYISGIGYDRLNTYLIRRNGRYHGEKIQDILRDIYDK